jgi:DNA-directed RNA polymerase specialized sigma24 family protein/CheY-like chemotaxis protein
MTFSAMIGPELPYLRRYARALTGSQSLGDAAVRETLEALLEDPAAFQESPQPRTELYRIFCQLWGGKQLSNLSGSTSITGVVDQLPIRHRQVLLLTAVEGFSVDQTATILAVSSDEVKGDIDAARSEIDDGLTARIMIIEDEPIIALHIRSIVEKLSHTITGIARTRSEAVNLASSTKPDLILADISLADGSSGIDAVKDILNETDVPVIFITAFPERLLTGDRPEPTYLITKPFEPETVIATIGQALFFYREQQPVVG